MTIREKPFKYSSLMAPMVRRRDRAYSLTLLSGCKTIDPGALTYSLTLLSGCKTIDPGALTYSLTLLSGCKTLDRGALTYSTTPFRGTELP